MPSRTLTPDPPTASGQRTSPESPASFELRLIAVPSGWPPYDCETHGAACPAARAAAVVDPHVSHQPTTLAKPPEPTAPGPAPGQGVAGQRAAGSAGSAGQGGAGRSIALPRQFAQVIVEILAGSRPLRQTVGWTTDRVRAQIGDLTRLLASDQRPRIRRVVTSQPAASVVEMTVVVSFGMRSRALAMRFEHMPARQPAPGLPARPARWLCTELETG